MFLPLSDFVIFFFRSQMAVFLCFFFISCFIPSLPTYYYFNIFYSVFFFNKNIFKVGFLYFYIKPSTLLFKNINYLFSSRLPSVLAYNSLSKKNLLTFFKTNEFIV